MIVELGEVKMGGKRQCTEKKRIKNGGGLGVATGRPEVLKKEERNVRKRLRREEQAIFKPGIACKGATPVRWVLLGSRLARGYRM